jgi:hypothetical protein
MEEADLTNIPTGDVWRFVSPKMITAITDFVQENVPPSGLESNPNPLAHSTLKVHFRDYQVSCSGTVTGGVQFAHAPASWALLNHVDIGIPSTRFAPQTILVSFQQSVSPTPFGEIGIPSTRSAPLAILVSFLSTVSPTPTGEIGIPSTRSAPLAILVSFLSSVSPTPSGEIGIPSMRSAPLAILVSFLSSVRPTPSGESGIYPQESESYSTSRGRCPQESESYSTSRGRCP